MTPGKNQKRYLAGAMDAHGRRIIWTEGKAKSSWLFIGLLDRLNQAYPERRRIHVILDNYVIHHSRTTRTALQRYDGRIVLHFLPPYCPDENKIERSLWREVHANVTRNHNCRTMDELIREVRHYLKTYDSRAAARAIVTVYRVFL